MNEEILFLFYTKKRKQIEIAKELNVSVSTISRVVQRDNRYLDEKEKRKQENKLKHKKQVQRFVEKSRKMKQYKNSNDDLILRNMHNQATAEMSKRAYLTNESYRKWNYSAYKYNPSKKRYEFRDELGRSADVPKYINERI